MKLSPIDAEQLEVSNKWQNRHQNMKMTIQVGVVMLLGALSSGCVSNQSTQAQQLALQRGEYLLSISNAKPGEVYDVGVYIITKGDTVALISKKFGITIKEFVLMNPGVQPKRLRVGQAVRIHEAIRQQ